MTNISKDIDECWLGMDSGCSQICSNNEGSYNCKCLAGYKLNGNQKICQGLYKILFTSYSFTLLFTTSYYLLYITLYTLSVYGNRSFVSNLVRESVIHI